MAENELVRMIDEYFDGELKSGDEPVLFMLLSKDNEARDYFRKHHLLKTVTDNMMVGFPQSIDEKIFNKIYSSARPGFFKRKISPVFAIPVMVILLLLSLFFLNEVNKYHSDLSQIRFELRQQNKTIRLLMNSLPDAEIRASKSNEIIIKSN